MNYLMSGLNFIYLCLQAHPDLSYIEYNHVPTFDLDPALGWNGLDTYLIMPHDAGTPPLSTACPITLGKPRRSSRE